MNNPPQSAPLFLVKSEKWKVERTEKIGKSKVRTFEDLIAWQKARLLTKAIYDVTRGSEFSKDFALCSQIRRAAVSIMANTAEGFERPTTREFLRFLVIAKSSCAEVRSHLIIANDIHYLTESEYRALQAKAIELSRVLSGLLISISQKIGSDKT